jgi:hypothetical protein
VPDPAGENVPDLGERMQEILLARPLGDHRE